MVEEQLQSTKEYFFHLIKKNGPDPIDYETLDDDLKNLLRLADDQSRRRDWPALRADLTDILRPECLQGRALHKPRGYPGDFWLLDQIYLEAICEIPILIKWDRYFQRQAAAIAVRNRKSYFLRQLVDLNRMVPTGTILEIGAASGRQYQQWFTSDPNSKLTFHAVELDPLALELARKLNHDFLDKISFIQKSPARFSPSRCYDLIWIPGYADYLTASELARFLQKWFQYLNPSGQLIFGNFLSGNPSQAYMEIIGDWYLLYRTPEELLEISKMAIPQAKKIEFRTEPQKVNGFIHLYN